MCTHAHPLTHNFATPRFLDPPLSPSLSPLPPPPPPPKHTHNNYNYNNNNNYPAKSHMYTLQWWIHYSVPTYWWTVTLNHTWTVMLNSAYTAVMNLLLNASLLMNCHAESCIHHSDEFITQCPPTDEMSRWIKYTLQWCITQCQLTNEQSCWITLTLQW